MRYILLVLSTLWLGLPTALADQSQGQPFAVVELFSSEGCSSCPSADLLISQLTRWARQNNEPVYPLVFDVDYWNYLGWSDVFSSNEFTQRQNTYAQILKYQGVYTPQVIVNGHDAFVGSDQDKLQKALDNALSVPTEVILHISFTKHDKRIIVNYSVEGFSKGDVVNIALVERDLSTQVTAGENAGRTLHHDNVVREFLTRPLIEASSQIVMPLYRISDISQASVIVYVQNPQTMLIEAASQADLK